jgi:hypothetical protein
MMELKSVGMMTFPIYGKIKKKNKQTTNQITIVARYSGKYFGGCRPSPFSSH